MPTKRMVNEYLHSHRECETYEYEICAPFLPPPDTPESKSICDSRYDVDERVAARRNEPGGIQMRKHYDNAPYLRKKSECTKYQENVDEYSTDEIPRERKSRNQAEALEYEECYNDNDKDEHRCHRMIISTSKWLFG